MIPDLVGLIIGAGLTLLVFSYLLGDNPIYRLVLHIFTGALLGYTFAIIGIELLNKAEQGNPIALAVPVVIGLVLLFKFSRRFAYVGNFALAYLIGVGVAVALLGALMGTFVPQLEAISHATRLDAQSPVLSLATGLISVGGTFCTLFTFDLILSQKRHSLAGLLGSGVRTLGFIGRIFLTIALSVAFASALSASLSFFIGRVEYILQLLAEFL